MYIFLGILLPTFFLFATQNVYALSTNTVNLQGKIVRNDTGYEGLNVTTGNPSCVVDGASNDTCDFRVRYYSASSGGTLFLTEEFSNEEIGQYNGAFNLSLGSDGSPTAGSYSSLDALIEAEDEVYVEIGFDPTGANSYTEVFTRMPLQATAYAIRAKYASNASTAFQFDTAANSSGYASPSAGMVYFDTTDTTLKVYDGATWVDIGSGSGGSSLWTDDGLFTYLTELTDHFVLGANSYTAIGTDTYNTYVAGLGTRPPMSFDMGAERQTISGSQARSGLSVYSNYASTGAWPLVLFKAEDSGFDNLVLEIVQDGTGNLMSMKKGSTEVFAFENAMTFFMRPRDTAPAISQNRLYNVGGTLYWNGTALATGGSSLWTDAGTYTYLTDSGDDLIIGGTSSGTAAFYFDVANGRLGIGTGTPSSALEIAGASSIISNSAGDITISPEESLVIKAQNADPDNLTEWQNSSGTILSLINQSGYASFGKSTGSTTAMLSLGANTSSVAQLNFAASSAIDVSTPNTGDLWYNGTNLYFYDGTDHIDLLVGNSDGVGLFSEYGSVDNGSYLNVAHNDDTYSILADGWICVGGSENASCTGGNWKNIKEESVTIRHALMEDWEDAGAEGIIRTDVRDTSVSLSPAFNPGTGSDGDVTVQYNTNINTTSLSAGRSCADGGDAVNYNITAFTSSTTATLSSAPSVGCLAVGDEVLIINLQGTYTAMDNVGNYETLEISDVTGTTVTFKTAKKNYYGDGLTDDTNLGVIAGTQRVMLQRVPHYRNLTINSGINFYPSAWNGVKGGVIFFRASVSANINGTIDVSGIGYRGGAAAAYQQGSSGGEAFCGPGGTGATTATNGTSGAAGGGAYNGGYLGGNGYCGGGGGASDDSTLGLGSANRGGAGGGAEYAAAGSGGGYGTPGGGGWNHSASEGSSGGTNSSANGTLSTSVSFSAGGGGGTYGDSNLSKLFFGSAGSGGTVGTTGNPGPGGNGGGIIGIYSKNIIISGSLLSAGSAGASVTVTNGSGAGGGAGGSVLLGAQTVNTGSSFVNVDGGSGGTGLGTNWSVATGGAGGDGRIAVYYSDSYSGTTANASVTNYYQSGYNSYGIYNSPVIPTPNAQTYDNIRWSQDLDTYGNISIQTRSGSSTNPLDGTWEEWRPFNSDDNYIMLESADTHTNWSGSNATVSDGDVTRNVDYFEDEDMIQGAVIDSDNYSESNYGGTSYFVYGANGKQGQSFTGNGGILDSVKFYLQRSGNPTGDCHVKIYSHSGTYGTSSTPNTLLATSDILNVSSIGTSFSLVNFTFSGVNKITLNNGTYYVAIFEYTNGDFDNRVAIAADSTSPTHSGNGVWNNGSWQANSGYDVIFYTYTSAAPAESTKIVSSTNGGYAEATGPVGIDLSNYDYITAWVRASQIGNTLRLGFGESAGTEQYEDITIDASDTWQKVYWDISDIATANRDGVTKLRLTNQTSSSNTIYLDNVRAEKLVTENEGSDIASTPNEYMQYRVIFTTTDLAYQPILRNITISYNSGYQIVIYDNNNVRLYNYSGGTKYLKLDVATSGGAGGGTGTGFVAGVVTSTVSDGTDAVAFTFNTPTSYSDPSSKLLSVMNNSTEKMYLDSNGNLYVSGSVIAGNGIASGLVNNSGGAIAQRSLVTVDPTANNSFTTTDIENQKGAFGVVTGVNVNGDINKNGVCDNGDTCIVAFDGVVNVTTSNAGTTSVGDYIYSSNTEGSAKSDSEQADGMIGVVTSVANSGSGYVKMVFDTQNKVTADLYMNVGFDKNAYRDMYTLLAKKYQEMTLAERRGVIETNQSESIMFDTFVDGLKIDSENSTVALDSLKRKMGLWGGRTFNNTNQDSAGNSYLGVSDANDTYYYDRTQTGDVNSNQDSTQETLVDLGIDPYWYNGVSLITGCTHNCSKESNLSTSYNGSLFTVSGMYATSSEHGNIDIKVVGQGPSSITANIASSDGTCSVSGANLIFGNEYSFTAGSCSGSNIKITPKRSNYTYGDTFRISSWYVEPTTANDRGARRSFPERAYIVGTSAGIDILDADTDKLWMRFGEGTGYVFGSTDMSISSVHMLNGVLYAGDDNGTDATGLYRLSFVEDEAYLVDDDATDMFGSGVIDRNTNTGYTEFNGEVEIIDDTVNDVHSAVIPNQPTQEVTVSGWNCLANTGGTYLYEGDFYLPYTFDEAPTLTGETIGMSNGMPESIESLIHATAVQTTFHNVQKNKFSARMWWTSNFGDADDYRCFSWTATGTVSPRSYTAVATDGGTSVVNESDRSVVDIYSTSYTDGNAWDDEKVWLTSSGDLYIGLHDTADDSANGVRTFYSVNTQSADDSTLSTVDVAYSEQNPAPRKTLPDLTEIYDLYVTEKTSSLDFSANTIYLATDSGTYTLNEKRDLGNQDTGTDNHNGSTKIYSKDFISEEMIGDVRGMWGFYDLDSDIDTSETTSEISVNGFDAVATNSNGTGFTSVSGIRGEGVTFDGVDDYFTVTDNSLLSFPNNVISVSLWMKKNGNPAASEYILYKGASSNYEYNVRVNTNGSIQMGLWQLSGATYASLPSNSTVTDNEWHHIVLVCDAASLSVYVDGKMESSTTSLTGTMGDGSGDLIIGDRPGTADAEYEGSLDELMITGEALTSSQIERIYRTGKRALDGSHGTNDFKNNLSSNGTGFGGTDIAKSIGVDANGYMYVGMDGSGSDDGWVSKIDLSSDTQVDQYTTSTTIALADNDVATIVVSSSGLELVGTDGVGVRHIPYDTNGNDTTGIYYSQPVTFASNSNKAYMWMNAYIDSSDVSSDMTVSVSNDGGSTYVEGNLIRSVGTTVKEYEYSFDFEAADNEYIVKIELERATSKKSTIYVTDWGLAQMDISTASGSGIYTNTDNTVGNKEYVEVVHGQNTFNILATGWVYNTTLAKWVKTSDSSVTVNHGKDSDWLKDPSVTVIPGTAGDVDSGSGSDGSITVSSNTNINRTSLITGRSCADGGDAVNYNITAFNVAGNEATLNRAPSSGCLASGDEVLVINLQGTYSAMDNTGNWEILTIDNVVGSTVTFTTNKTKYYGNNLNDDTNLGTAANTQRVMLQRVPQYVDVTVNASINFYPDEWATEAAENATYRVSKGGVMFFKASGSVNINGNIHATGKGYQGGTQEGGYAYGGGQGGEAFCGLGGNGAITNGFAGAGGGGSSSTNTAGLGYCGGGGGGGATVVNGSTNYGGAGGGGGRRSGGGAGGYGTAGTSGTYNALTYGATDGGTNSSGSGGSAPDYGAGGGGGTYGDAELTKLMFGSGGGRGGNNASPQLGGAGGDGGGVVYISAGSVTVSGTLASDGVIGGNGASGTSYYTGAGGGGAGGAVRIDAATVNIGPSKVTVTGGASGVGRFNNTAVNNGGTGGSGRVAVYYTDSYSGTSGTPAVTNFYELDEMTVGDAEVVAPSGIIRTIIGLTDISLESGVDTGDGRDGNVTVSSNTNINRTSLIAGRSCADGGDAVNYNVLSFNSAGTEATLNRAPSAGCLSVGDEVLVINLQGTFSAMDNVGNWETLRIQSVSSSTVVFTKAKERYYGDGLNDDNNLGVGENMQRVMLQRVPNYQNLTVNSGINFYPDAWATETAENATYRISKGGVIFFRATGSVNVNGTIHANGLGYRGGTNNSGGGDGGEAFCGLGGSGGDASVVGGSGASGGGATLGGGNGYCGGGGGSYTGNTPGLGSPNRGGSGGGAGRNTAAGGGGGYGTPGTGGGGLTTEESGENGGTNKSGSGGVGSDGGGGGGGSYGIESLSKVFFGSSGGAGSDNGANLGGQGGNGGGIVLINANSVAISGNIYSNGTAGSNAQTATNYAGGGGGGAGGSVKIDGNSVLLGSSRIFVSGGSGGLPSTGARYGGTGGNGRIAVYYTESFSGTSGTPGTTNFYEGGSYTYGMYHSNVIPTIGAGSFSDFRWNFDNDTYGQISIQTRTGATTDPTDGSWEEWRPTDSNSANTTLQDADNASSWVGTNVTVSDGDTTRDVDFFEDEDELTSGNITKMVSSTNGGYSEATISAIDLSGYDYITMWVKASVINQSLSFSMGESSGDEHTENIVIDSLEWQKVYWDITDIASENRNAITKLRITNLTSSTNTYYIDNVKAEILPTSGLDEIYSTPNDYLQYRVIFTTTDTRYRPIFSSISFTYNIGYKIVQVDSNKVRLYNNSGATQKLRLDVVTGGLVFELSQGNNASVNLSPAVAQVDSEDYKNSIWINRTGTGGNLLKLQTAGADSFVVNTDGNLTMAGDIEVQGGSIKLGDSGWIRFNDATNVLEFTNDGSDWIALGPLYTSIVLSAEYSGAVLSADGSNNTGNMTADSDALNNSMNYYEWNSSEASLNDYDVRIRFTLPSDFDSWSVGGITFNFATESTSSVSNQLDFYVYEETSASIDGQSEDQVSSVAGTWTSTTVSGSGLTECVSAGDVCMLIVKMSSSNDNYVRVGDIGIGYNRKL